MSHDFTYDEDDVSYDDEMFLFDGAAVDTEANDHGYQTVVPLYRHQIGEKPITLRNNEGLTINQITNSTVGTFDIELIFTEDTVV